MVLIGVRGGGGWVSSSSWQLCNVHLTILKSFLCSGILINIKHWSALFRRKVHHRGRRKHWLIISHLRQYIHCVIGPVKPHPAKQQGTLVDVPCDIALITSQHWGHVSSGHLRFLSSVQVVNAPTPLLGRRRYLDHHPTRNQGAAHPPGLTLTCDPVRDTLLLRGKTTDAKWKISPETSLWGRKPEDPQYRQN